MSDRVAEHAALFEAVGRAIVERRRELGLRQEEVSLACGFNRAYLSVIERGKRNATLATLASIAKVLDWRLSELFHAAGH